MYLTIILVLLFTVFAWLSLDYKLGRKSYLKKVNKREFPIRKSNLSLFTNGENLFDDLFAEIANAKKHINILFYIVNDDEISHDFFSLLKEKAKSGVEVRLLIDWIGGHKVTRNMIRSLKQSGVHFHYTHKPRLPFLFYSLNARNHRKIAVIDGTLGYLGGFNIGQEYLGKDPKYGFWRDYHLKINGEGVQDLQTQFLLDWKDASKDDLSGEESFFPPLLEGDLSIKLVPTDGAFLQSYLLDLIATARDEILIGSPYFIPGKKITEALVEAAQRGIKIKVLIPRIADHPFVKDAAFPYFKILKKQGIQFYYYEKGFYHSKVFVVDDIICDIGTANLDKRSLYSNHELNCFIYNKPFILQVKNEIRKDLIDSSPITDDEIKNRTFLQKGRESVSTLLSNFL